MQMLVFHYCCVVVAIKTEVSICALPFLLVPPPPRGVRGPRIPRTSVLEMLFMNFKVLLLLILS